MTLSLNDRLTPFLGDGSTKAFNYDFPADNANEIVVFTDTSIVDSADYSVDLVSQTVTFDDAPASGVKGAITSATAITQEVVYSRQNNSLNLKELADQLDMLAKGVQEAQRDIDRSLRLIPGNTTTSRPLLLKAEDGKVVGWSNGRIANLSPVAIDAATVAGTIGLELLADETAADAAETLGSIIIRPVADRTELAALDVTKFSFTYLNEARREGIFKRVNTVEYSTWITADTAQGMFVLSTDDAAYAWMRVGERRHNIMHFGAVDDGAVDIDESNPYTPTGTGAVTGTDNLAAVKGANELHKLTNFPIFVPKGSFRCFVTGADQENIIEVGSKFHIFTDAPGEAWLIADDDRTYNGSGGAGQLGNNFIGAPQIFESANYDQSENDYFIVRGIGIRGTWWREMEGLQDKTWTASQPYRLHAFAPSNTHFILFDQVEARDILGFFSRARTGWKIKYLDCDIRRICGDGLRAEDCSHVIWDHNYILHCDDDAITNPDLDDMPNTQRSRRQSAIMVNNQIEASEGPVVLGPAFLLATGNQMQRCYGSGLTIFAQTGDTANRGEGGFRSVLVAHNLIEDQLKSHQLANPPDGAWGGDVHAMNVQGAIAAAITTASPIGEGSGTPTTEPWYSGDFDWGAMHLQDQVGSDPDAASGYRGSGAVVGPNIIRRTLPPATNYSDWGFGQRFSRWGFDDPQVTDAEFALNGIRFGGSFNGLTFYVGDISGFKSGAGIRLDGTTTDHRYQNFKIVGGIVWHVKHGVDCDSGATHYQDIEVDGVTFDCDPFRVQSARAAGNKWTSTTASDPTGVHLTFLYGPKIRNCTFKNCANMWTLEGGAVENLAHSVLLGNIGVVDFGNAGTSSTHADNRGIGRIPLCSDMVTYEVRDLDPASGTFNQTRAGMLRYNSATPGSGYYVRGHFVTLTGGGLKQRLTTGTGHVDGGTDWVSI